MCFALVLVIFGALGLNYLARIHLAHLTHTSLLGNFAGDFVKGDRVESYPAQIANGIKLHRKIDGFTDQHEIVRRLKRGFPKNIRRLSGVTLDIFFDHLLCSNWQRWTEQSLEKVLDDFYLQLSQSDIVFSERFARIKQNLLRDRWLQHYQHPAHCLQAFLAIEKRLGHRIAFAHQSWEYLFGQKADLEPAFLTFYPDLIQYTQTLARQVNVSS